MALQLLQQNLVIHRSEVVRDITFDDVDWRSRRTENCPDSRLATIQAECVISICVRGRREPIMQPPVQQTIDQQIHNPLFPWRNVKRPTLAVEVIFEPYGRPKVKPFSV